MQTAPSTNEFLIPKKADCYEGTGIVWVEIGAVDCNAISVLNPHQTSTCPPNHNCIIVLKALKVQNIRQSLHKSTIKIFKKIKSLIVQ